MSFKIIHKEPVKHLDIKKLRRMGFDESEYDRSSETRRIKCSQCEAIVINGVACHEHGCPNRRT
jgi:hypothetical protein